MIKILNLSIKFELLGPSLADMNPPFSLKTVLMIAV